MESSKLPARVVVPHDIQELSRHIEEWRSSRRRRMPMPEPLWTRAANLARQYSVAQVSRFLRLDYYSLKERLKQQASSSTAQETNDIATFLELPAPARPGVSECLLELEDADGAKMRIQLKGVETPDLVALSRSFWES